jgi:hypothetical protein
MVHENHCRLRPPLTGRQKPAFNVAAVAAMLEHAKEDVVMALAYRNDFGPEEGVIARRKEEERLLDFAKQGRNF